MCAKNEGEDGTAAGSVAVEIAAMLHTADGADFFGAGSSSGTV
jgi:hypothetical protein